MVPGLLGFFHAGADCAEIAAKLCLVVLPVSMQLDLSADDAAFVAEVQAFVATHSTIARDRNTRAWYRVLREHQWFVPHWPWTLGGLGWPPRRLYLWQRELLRAGAHLPPASTTHHIASLLQGCLRALSQLPAMLADADTRRLADRCRAGLQGIADGTQRWAVGLDLRQPDWPAAAAAGRQVPTGADWVLYPYPQAAPGSPERIDRWAIAVLPGLQKTASNSSHPARTQVELRAQCEANSIQQDLSLALAEQLLVPVQLSARADLGPEGPKALADQSPDVHLGDVHLGDVNLGEAQVSDVPLGDDRPTPVTWGVMVPSVRLAARLSRVQQVVEQVALDSASEALEDTQQPGSVGANYALAQIDLRALQVLEARAAQGGIDNQLPMVVSRRAVQLASVVAQLEADVLGYYALPEFDEALQHNEGPIAPSVLASLVGSNERRR